MKILLTEPLCPGEATWGKFKKGAGSNTFSYGLASIAANCKKNGFNDITFIEPQIENMSKEDYTTFLKLNQFDFVGLASCTATMDFTYDTIRLIKKTLPDSTIILGGIHSTLLPEETLKECKELDIVCIGEGEVTFVEILQKKKLEDINGIAWRENNCIAINKPRPVIEDINTLPMPAYEIFPMDKYRTQITNAKVFPTKTMLVSRGCVYDCAFCNANVVHGRKVRYKTPENIIKEMLHLKNHYGARGIAFLDSTLTINKDWVHRFCDLMVEKNIKIPWNCYSRTDTIDKEMLVKMKKTGCWGLNIGVESGNQKTLDSIEKGVTVKQNTDTVKLALDLGFFVYANYIICWPGEDKNDALNTIKYAKELATHSALFYLPVPFPKTKLYQLCREDGGLKENAKWGDFNAWNYDNPVYVNPKIGKEEMQRLYNHAYKTYFRTPMVLWRNLKEIRNWDAIKKYYYAARCLL